MLALAGKTHTRLYEELDIPTIAKLIKDRNLGKVQRKYRNKTNEPGKREPTKHAF